MEMVGPRLDPGGTVILAAACAEWLIGHMIPNRFTCARKLKMCGLQPERMETLRGLRPRVILTVFLRK